MPWSYAGRLETRSLVSRKAMRPNDLEDAQNALALGAANVKSAASSEANRLIIIKCVNAFK